MSTYTILRYPDSRLRNRATIVQDFGAVTQGIIDKMIRTVNESGDGIGLAAVQVGEPWDIFIVNLKGNETDWQAYINARITRRHGLVLSREACLSVGPRGNRVSAMIKRAHSIDVTFQDRHGEHHEMRDVSGLLAQCIQHESDHNQGVLFIDHLPKWRRKMLLRGSDCA